MRKLAIGLIFLILSGCASEQVQYINTPLPIPPEPSYPTIAADELQCLSNDTYYKLVHRDILRKYYIKTLIGIIQSTHKNDED